MMVVESSAGTVSRPTTELDPKAGRFEDEANMVCDMFCQVEAEEFLEK